MPSIISVGTCQLPHRIEQDEAMDLAKNIFEEKFVDIERRLQIFHNGQIKQRYFSMPLEWFKEEHTFEEKNNLYIRLATQFGIEAIKDCLQSNVFLKVEVPYEEIDALIYISSTGIATPSIEARIMNKLPFSTKLKRIPIWGLGCAGGAAGLARAYEYCLAFPQAKVLVLSVELCSLTFQRRDFSKSNLVGSSLFADGVACALVSGNEVDIADYSRLLAYPQVKATQSTLLPDSEEVMGWHVQDQGLSVIFSKDIPQLIKTWLRPQVERFLAEHDLRIEDIEQFIAHPGGKKVIEAYEETLQLRKGMTQAAQEILEQFGNMSSATVLYLLKHVLHNQLRTGEILANQFGILAALGPGFSSELLLLQWSRG